MITSVCIKKPGYVAFAPHIQPRRHVQAPSIWVHYVDTIVNSWRLNGSIDWTSFGYYSPMENMQPCWISPCTIANCLYTAYWFLDRRSHSRFLRVAGIKVGHPNLKELAVGSFSIWHWLIVLLFIVGPAWLFSRIVAKAGFSGWWALAGLVPPVNLVFLWVFAFSKWPTIPKHQ